MGTSNDMWRAKYMERDHPHAYGDKAVYSPNALSMSGSSPRVWGQGRDLKQSDFSDRIIPTRMGTSCRANIPCCQCRDHPHAYGDKRSFAPFVSLSIGSSPRVWGQGNICCCHIFTRRIIPTRMGTS